MLIEGRLPASYAPLAREVAAYFAGNSPGDSASSRHHWIDRQGGRIRVALERLRRASAIPDAIGRAYRGYAVVPVPESDEVYVSVDPSKRRNSDVALSDCHFDAPFRRVYQCGNVFVRVILALTPNRTTYTTVGTRKSALSRLDFNAMDYNADYHCVEGCIPRGSSRVLLKLHFLCMHPSSPPRCADFARALNDRWTHLSREIMRVSANPTTLPQKALAGTVVVAMHLYRHASLVLGVLVLGTIALVGTRARAPGR